MSRICFLLVCIFYVMNSEAQIPNPDTIKKENKHWYDIISIRGYAQLRYNRLLETNPNLKCEQCDKSIGENGGFSFRRIRLVFSGNVNEHLYFYIQPDMANVASGNNTHFFQLRDAYFDYAFDKDKTLRLRFGQSKIPFGFENMQSSQNRLTLDRSDAINSATPNERELGVFLYWANKEKRALFKRLVDEGLKGSGDYGIFGIGIYNGSGTNKIENNNNLYTVARITYPFELKSQIIEPGIQAYTGKYKITADQMSQGYDIQHTAEFIDQRIGATIVLYPKPLGVMAEYNIGKTPRFNTTKDTIESTTLHGLNITLSYLQRIKKCTFIPFIRYNYYNGGKKQELDARSYIVKDLEAGIEWQINKSLECTVEYQWSDRQFLDHIKQNNHQKGGFLRIQTQFNF
jgi:hypothetical protein